MRGSASSIHHHDDLAHGLARREPRDRFARFREREALGDLRLDRALAVKLDELAVVRGIGLGIALGESAPEYADDLARLQQREIERQSGDSGGEAAHQEAPPPGEGAKRRLAVAAAAGIVDPVGALLAASLLKEFRKCP